MHTIRLQAGYILHQVEQKMRSTSRAQKVSAFYCAYQNMFLSEKIVIETFLD